jgi:hypothetical protein
VSCRPRPVGAADSELLSALSLALSFGSLSLVIFGTLGMTRTNLIEPVTSTSDFLLEDNSE